MTQLKRKVFIGTIVLLSLLHSTIAIPAFPGAEGFGAGATGGRGGRVIKVTTLAASGPGSLQEALNVNAPRIIVFNVSGVINSDIVEVTYGNVYIAGQTAPGGGITINGRLYGAYELGVDNIIVRHLRIRPPSDKDEPEYRQDAVQFSRNANVILDHISASFGMDETVDIYEARNITVQWSTISEASLEGSEEEHNFGLLSGENGIRTSIHHNYFAHLRNRCPAIATGPAEVRNNVVYNVRFGFVHNNYASGQFNIIGNYYKKGPNDTLFPFYLDDGAGPGLAYYLNDNYIDDPNDYVGVVNNPWQTPYLHSSFEIIERDASYRSDTEFNFDNTPGFVPVTMHPSTNVYQPVLQKAGAFPRDVIDKQIVSEFESRTGAWGARHPSNLMEGLTPTSPPTDADNDGMADAWEVANGLNPADGNDHSTVRPSGYTAIEEYINCLAEQLIGGPACIKDDTESISASSTITSSACILVIVLLFL